MAWGTSTGTVAGQSAFTSSATYTAGAITCPIGDQIFLWVGFDNLTATTPVINSITVPGGETAAWVKLAAGDSPQSGAGGGVRGELWAITPTATWTAFTPVITLSGAVVAKASAGFCRSGGTLNARESIPKAGSNSQTASPAVTITNPVTGDLVIGTLSKETQAGVVTADADTTNGSWSAGIEAATTTGTASDVNAFLQHKVVTAGGTQTFNPTTTSVTDGTIIVLALPPASSPTTEQVTREHAETLVRPTPNEQVTREHAEVLVATTPTEQVSRVHVEVLFRVSTTSTSPYWSWMA